MNRGSLSLSCRSCRTTGSPSSYGIFLPVVILLLLTGCAAINPRLDLTKITGSEHRVLLDDVPFYAQEKYQCGPAALAGVLRYSGVDIVPDSLVREIYVPGRKGSLQVEILAATRRERRVPYPLGGSAEDIVLQLEAGRPVLVLQNLLTPHVPDWHYAVVVGFDAAANEFVLNSGVKQQLRISAGKFLRTWNWAGNWAMVALHPGEVPAGGDPVRFMRAVAAFEKVAGGDYARPSWEAAAQTWPQSSRPYLALGNLAYFGKDLPGAVVQYRKGLERTPEDPALLNNLATVLGELGCPRTAERLLRPVLDSIAADSDWYEEIDSTLSNLPTAPTEDPRMCAGYLSGWR